MVAEGRDRGLRTEGRMSYLREPGEVADEGGDAACWANRVCPACGRLADEEPPTNCRECATEIPGPDD